MNIGVKVKVREDVDYNAENHKGGNKFGGGWLNTARKTLPGLVSFPSNLTQESSTD